MKSSAFIKLALLPTVALAIAGCTQDRDWAQCVDKDNRIVDDRQCDQQRSSGVGYNYWYYRWIYTNHAYPMGSQLRAGEFHVSPRATVPTARASEAAIVSRGGFGSSAHVGEAGGAGE